MTTYDDIERDLAGIGAEGTAAERLEQALSICALAPGLPGPDYASFKAWIIPQLMTEQELLSRDPTHPIATTLKKAVFLRLIDTSYVLQRHGKGEPDLATFNKMKLLYSLQLDSERGQQMAHALISKPDQNDPLDNLDNASPAELRLRLFASMGPEPGRRLRNGSSATLDP
jgi:hypothetical protein